VDRIILGHGREPTQRRISLLGVVALAEHVELTAEQQIRPDGDPHGQIQAEAGAALPGVIRQERAAGCAVDVRMARSHAEPDPEPLALDVARCRLLRSETRAATKERQDGQYPGSSLDRALHCLLTSR
jgi:hypothetical protein